MAGQFDYFVILAGMRTGSNLLEEQLNRFEGIRCLGEVFNPVFVGRPGQDSLYGMSVAEVAAEPLRMIARLTENARGLPGFRLFADHGRAVMDHVLTDPRCARIVLTRNPVDSYVSLQIARRTDQWKLGDARNRKTTRITFDSAGFAAYLQANRDHYAHIRRVARSCGLALFEIGYDELSDEAMIEGLVRYLGISRPRAQGAVKIRKQNPEPLSEKVSNYDEMIAGLAGLDPLGLMAETIFEPTRGAGIGRYLACHTAPVLFMPVRSGPERAVAAWMAALDDGVEPQAGFSQKTLRQWKRRRGDHRSFTVIRHPALRAFTAFLRHLVEPGPEHFPAIRDVLIRRYKVPLPEPGPADQADPAVLKGGYLAFLTFLKSNLAGQTAVRVDPAWASQAATLSGMAGFAAPDHVFREETLARDLAYLCQTLGVDCPQPPAEPEPAGLYAAIHDDAVEAAARAAYQRDYMMFGFGPWQG